MYTFILLYTFSDIHHYVTCKPCKSTLSRLNYTYTVAHYTTVHLVICSTQKQKYLWLKSARKTSLVTILSEGRPSHSEYSISPFQKIHQTITPSNRTINQNQNPKNRRIKTVMGTPLPRALNS